ncbi:MAG: BACON domain-containing protein [Muribaculaceae bacterium]|nr:BACON domain-containing protein [Muribaculaceae bacterium]
MKLKYFISFFALVALLSSCSDDDSMTLLDEIKVSSSYVGIDVDGGSNTITLNAKEAWSFDAEEIPAWLTVSPMNGGAGETKVTFTAPSTMDGRTAVLHVSCADKSQTINVIQGLAVVSPATCAEIIAGPESKTYRVTGTVATITNTTYGNWILRDETGEITIYGTLDAKGNEKNFLSWGMEVGDIVTVEGPKQLYGTTVELVNVTVVNIQKSLVKVEGYDPEDATIPVEGGNVAVNLTCKTNNGISVEIPEEAKSWLGIVSVAGGAEPVVTFHANANAGGDRSTTVVFKTTDDKGQEYTAEAVINQKGSIQEMSIADFLLEPTENNNSLYRITGVITSIANPTYGNVYIRDWSGEVYVYGIGAKGFFETTGLKVGDVVTLVGKRAVYKGTDQLSNTTLEDYKTVTPMTIDEFLDQEDNPNVYYMLTGNITEVANATYGNLYLEDETNQVYVYGCYPGWGATGDNRKNWLETAGIAVGDELSVIGVKSTYNGTPQLANGIYFSHKKAQ